MSTPLILAILDGWGIAEPVSSNAIHVADTPNMDRWSSEFPMTTLTAHNGMVGLPEGQMGNSEVGHLNIGAGRIVYQDFTRINLEVESGALSANKVLTAAMEQTRSKGVRLHLLGLLSDGGVHSHISHLTAMVAMAKQQGVEQVFLHCFMDGRDTPPSSGAGYMEQLVGSLDSIDLGRVATVCGRYWAMDRDKRWDRVEKAYQAIVEGKGVFSADPIQAVGEAYLREETDEFIAPTVLTGENGRPVGRVEDGDVLVFFNFRADRVRELCHALTDSDFEQFSVNSRPQLGSLVTMTEYEETFNFPVAYPPLSLSGILGETVSSQGKHQLRIAETEKYAHVTYFFNGGLEEPFIGEDRILVNSPRDVATYDLKPEMSAVEVTDRLLAAIDEQEQAGTPYDLVVLNFANGDMVGHTGILDAAVKACATVDQCMGRVREYQKAHGGTILITADHGNAEIMVDPETSGPYTAHTLSPVPFILVGDEYRHTKLKSGCALRDIAPTILDIMRLPLPESMDGETLLIEE